METLFFIVFGLVGSQETITQYAFCTLGIQGLSQGLYKE